MVEWHHRLNGREFEQTLGDSEGQTGARSPLGPKESDTTQRLNNKEVVYGLHGTLPSPGSLHVQIRKESMFTSFLITTQITKIWFSLFQGS